MDIKQLTDIKEKIQRAKSEAAEARGQEKYLQEELREKWHCEDIEMAENVKDDFLSKASLIKEQEDELIEDIKRKYPI